ncbi:Protein of unknown function [Bacillus mycoides]|nr:Protein of unknown function [Bacillus mycoides]
MVKLNL